MRGRQFVEAQGRRPARLARVRDLAGSPGGSAEVAWQGRSRRRIRPRARLRSVDPDNGGWLPPHRGRRDRCGAMTADQGGDEAVEILLYALNYAASTGGRGPTRRVATAGSSRTCAGSRGTPDARLGDAVRLAAASPDERQPPLTSCHQHPGAAPGHAWGPPAKVTADRTLVTGCAGGGAILRPQSVRGGLHDPRARLLSGTLHRRPCHRGMWWSDPPTTSPSDAPLVAGPRPRPWPHARTRRRVEAPARAAGPDVGAAGRALDDIQRYALDDQGSGRPGRPGAARSRCPAPWTTLSRMRPRSRCPA